MKDLPMIFSTTTTDQYFKSIAKYWEDGSYSKIITDIKGKNKRKDAKRSFRRLVCKDRRFKNEKNETGALQLFKNLQYKKYEELKVAAFENKEGYSRNNEMTIKEEIDLVIEHIKQKISIDKIFDWIEIPKKEYKYEIIHNAHTWHKGHLKAAYTYKEIMKSRKLCGLTWEGYF